MKENSYYFLIQARMGSTRLPQKSLLKIHNNYSLIDIVIKRTLLSKYANHDNTIVLTTNSPIDNVLCEYLQKAGIPYFRGDEKNVFNRFKNFLQQSDFKPYFFRICADNPFLAPEFFDNLIKLQMKNPNYDYYSYKLKDKPAILTHYGLFGELLNTKTFLKVNEKDLNEIEMEHVTPIFYRNKMYKTKFIKIPAFISKFKNLRLTLDTEEDYEMTKKIYAKLNKIDFSTKELINIFLTSSDLLDKMKTIIYNNKKELK